MHNLAVHVCINEKSEIKRKDYHTKAEITLL